MKLVGMFSVGENPSTSQLIIPGAATRHHLLEKNEATQLELPFDNPVDCPYCNDCSFLLKIQRPNKTTFNTRCTAETTRPGGSERVISLNVYIDEKINKPFWCPMLKQAVTNSLNNNNAMKIGPKVIYLDKKNNTLQLSGIEKAKADKTIREKWLSAPGLTSWNELELGKVYHLPPTTKKRRMDVKIVRRFMTSIQAKDIRTDENVWFYKDDEEYKYMSLLNNSGK